MSGTQTLKLACAEPDLAVVAQALSSRGVTAQRVGEELRATLHDGGELSGVGGAGRRGRVRGMSRLERLGPLEGSAYSAGGEAEVAARLESLGCM